MDDQGSGNDKYDLNLLRGWQRSQLKLLKRFTKMEYVSQSFMANVSGSAIHSHELGGKITPLTRAGLIEKVGRDDDGTQLWKLNNSKVDIQKLLDILNDMGIEDDNNENGSHSGSYVLGDTFNK